MNRAKQNDGTRVDDSGVGRRGVFRSVSRGPAITTPVGHRGVLSPVPLVALTYNEYLDRLAEIEREGIRNS